MTDRLSMKNSIEARTPFLDNELIKYINTVDINELSSKYDYKIGLRKLFNFENPGFELSNSKKGFNVPDDMVYKAFNKEIEYLLSYDFIKKQDIFNFKYIDSNSFKANKNLYKSLVYFQLFYFNSI
jgi:asparagine synthase (glutamine-hydrolysing)